jgi:hypothetical protein
MRPVRTIAALLLAAAGILAVPTAPAWAASTSTGVVVQTSPDPVVAGHTVTQSRLQVSPRSVTAGDTVTVSGWLPPAPGSECATGVALLSRAFVGTHEFADVPAIGAAVKPDGTFTVTTRIPRAKAAGTYDITGRCGGGNIGASATLVVRAAPTPTTTPAPAPPAPPVTHPQAPTPTAAPTPAGSARTPASQLGSRWVIPGLAAVGASTLAALGMWLLYRRQHPASLSR